MVEARTVLQVMEARCSMVENRFRIVEAHGVLAFLPSEGAKIAHSYSSPLPTRLS